MARIHLKHHHGLRREETHLRLERIARQLKHRYPIDYIWKGHRLYARYRGLSASVYLGEGWLELQIKLSLLFIPMRDRIERAIHRNLQDVISGRWDPLTQPSLAHNGRLVFESAGGSRTIGPGHALR
ncbi:MAG: polyhydroxyalkanoic acid system family protein [Gammaproteobacteria bacterium]|nr:polyhydroxyalkanoic acid system family protein [Gammaproteobacteria bacterium]